MNSPAHRPDSARCPACGYPAAVIWVHGHGQCGACGINIEPCCGGAPCPTPKLAAADPLPRSAAGSTADAG